jgi:hypothetical protein
VWRGDRARASFGMPAFHLRCVSEQSTQLLPPPGAKGMADYRTRGRAAGIHVCPGKIEVTTDLASALHPSLWFLTVLSCADPYSFSIPALQVPRFSNRATGHGDGEQVGQKESELRGWRCWAL